MIPSSSLRILLTVLLLCASIADMCAQVEDTTAVLDYTVSRPTLHGYPVSFKKGAFLIDYFSLGTLITRTGQRVTNVKLIYDITRDELVAIQANGQYINLHKTLLKGFYLFNGQTNTDHHFEKLIYENRESYLERRGVWGNITLYKKHQRKIKESSPTYGYGNQETGGMMDDSIYFIGVGDNLIAIDGSIRDNAVFLDLVGNDKDAVRRALKIRTDELELRKFIGEIRSGAIERDGKR